MNLAEFYQQQQNNISFSKRQASLFAKTVANDFNPIHDVNAKKFCVPGDLLFAVILDQYGLSQKMHFNFSGMVGENILLSLPTENPETTDELIPIKGSDNKEYLNFSMSGDITHNKNLVATFIQAYVKFSGKAFPHLLVPLMKQENVMINPDRPLVIYENMSLSLARLDIKDLQVQLHQTSIEVIAKRAKVCIEFDVLCHEEIIGQGKKNMILSGLREYQQQKVDALAQAYQLRSLSKDLI